jgi:hypothetical protein
MNNPSFESFDFKNGLLKDMSDSSYPCRLHGINGISEFETRCDASYFIFVHEGLVVVDDKFPILGGMYACVTGKDICSSQNNTKAFLIEVFNYKPPFILGGPVEEQGRLKYIDGCTDSLLVPPVRLGDPCLNHLHFPKDIIQTMHVHPTVRIGVVHRGEGRCVTPFGNVELYKGQVFVILPDSGKSFKGLDGNEHPEGSHCFYTTEKEMDVIAWHPDSDYGPTDENHPMINRTIVDGVPASQIDEIRTK